MAHVHHSNGLCALDASPNALDASYDPVGALQIHADPFRAAPRSSGRFDSGDTLPMAAKPLGTSSNLMPMDGERYPGHLKYSGVI